MNDARFAETYYAAWNARDLDAVLALYAEDVEFRSPYIAALGFASDGILFGRDALRDYFKAALERAPNLQFEPESLCVGAGGHVLIYRNHRGERAAEYHSFNAAGEVDLAEATYETVE